MAHAQVGQQRIYYEKHGDFSAPDAPPPLLLVMGMAGSCAGWLPLQVPEFAATRPVLIYDHRGVAQSDDPGGAFSIADLAEDARGLLDALEIERVDVLGTFMGGMTAQELALRHPERVAQLVLVGTYARPDAKRRLLLDHWASLATEGVSQQALLRDRLLWTLQDETLEQTDLIQAMTEFFEREGLPVAPELFARQCRACAAHDVHDRLPSLKQPTLVLCGRHDPLTPPKMHRELASLIPDARLTTLSYGAHLIMVESAERFNSIVLQFLNEREQP